MIKIKLVIFLVVLMFMMSACMTKNSKLVVDPTNVEVFYQNGGNNKALAEGRFGAIGAIVNSQSEIGAIEGALKNCNAAGLGLSNCKIVSVNGIRVNQDHSIDHEDIKRKSKHEILLDKAVKGDQKAQFQLGFNYSNGIDVDVDFVKAAKWYKKSAMQENVTAQYNLALIYDLGKMGERDSFSAFTWYLKAAMQGDADSQGNVGLMLLLGDGVDKDEKRAEHWLLKAAEKDNINSILNLGLLYMDRNDLYKSYRWYLKAAELNSPIAQNNVALALYKGIGVDQDSKMAYEWYKRSAAQGHANGMNGLAVMYLSGDYVDGDVGEAFRLIKGAADQGLGLGQNNLGRMFAYGLGVPKDLKEARYWYQAAINNPSSSETALRLAKVNFAELSAKEELRNVDRSAIDDISARPSVSVKLKGEGELTTFKSRVFIEGSINDISNLADLSIMNSLVPVLENGSFSTDVYVPIGQSEIIVTALDVNGNAFVQKILVTRDVDRDAVTEGRKPIVPPYNTTFHNENAVALIIGITEYESLPDALWSEIDAKYFYDYVKNVFGVPSTNIKFLGSNDATGKEIWRAVSQWLPAHMKRRKSDIYVFYSGHGLVSDKGTDTYLVPWDGDPSLLKRTAISRSELFEEIDKLEPKTVNVFLDTCYSGASKGGTDALIANARALRIVQKKSIDNVNDKFNLFSASSMNETASSHETLKHGLFSYWTMRGLGGEADSNTDRKITAGELHDFVSKNVERDAVSIGQKQHPQFVGDPDRVLASW